MQHLTAPTLSTSALAILGLFLAGCGDDEESTRQIEENDTQPVGDFSTDRKASDWQLFLDETEGIYPTEMCSAWTKNDRTPLLFWKIRFVWSLISNLMITSNHGEPANRQSSRYNGGWLIGGPVCHRV